MKLLKKIKSIGCFGSFRDFAWDENLINAKGKVFSFEPINFLFGRNYSGKTTLSKIVQTLESGKIPPHYDGAKFEVEFDDGTIIDESSVGHTTPPIRVFNRDFVSEQLAFLRDTRDDSGAIKSFAVLGPGAEDLEKKIKECQDRLGIEDEDDDKCTGLYQEERAAAKEIAAKQPKLIEARRKVESIVKAIATDSKTGVRYKPIFGKQNYTSRSFEDDSSTISEKKFEGLSDERIEFVKQILKESVKTPISKPRDLELNLPGLIEQARALLTKDVVTGEKIQDLLNDIDKENWVRDGYYFHDERGQRVCAFCGQTIPDERWNRLTRHFSDEIESLRYDIRELCEKIPGESVVPMTAFIVNENLVYAKYKQLYEDIRDRSLKALKVYSDTIQEYVRLLNDRNQNIATPYRGELPSDCCAVIRELYAELCSFVEKNNAYADHIADEQKVAREESRLHYVWLMMNKLGYHQAKATFDALDEEQKKRIEANQNRREEINKLVAELRDLRSQRNDASGAAKLINAYMSWVGEADQTLKLVPEEIEEAGIKSKVFRILRAEQPAYNLSEGECNLIAFCYFLAMLSSPELENDKPIVWIDDPISSLDSNHIFFVYAMIRNVILNEKRYNQLFVATHNLDFFRYLSKVGDWEIDANGVERRIRDAWFFVHREKKSSLIRPLPKYLQNYITEFAYLFAQIYIAAETDPSSEDYDKLMYGFGNAARRFLEIYLYYRFPNDQPDSNKEHAQRMKKVFGDTVKVFMIERVINEMSHGRGALENGMTPMDAKEVHLVAKTILKGIKTADSNQYAEFLKGIGKPDIV